MTLLEQKVDAIAQSLLAKDTAERDVALAELKVLMSADRSQDDRKSVAEQVDKCLLDLGVPERLIGYLYLREAIREVVKDPGLVFKITTDLYPRVAEAFGTTKSRLERAIRSAIETGWDRCDYETQVAYFGNTVSPNKGRPTNGEYIAKLASIVRSRLGGA